MSYACLIKPVGGTIIPASPCIGSTRNATVFGFMADFSSSMLPYSITLNPGVKGPYPFLASGSVLIETIVIVLPWKLLAHTIISCIPSSTPLTKFPHLLAVFKAVSTASAPVFIGRTMFLPVTSQSFCIQSPRTLL
ncbi:hypothetical protein SDC9_116712 [bioreactor metagenome]|uniref:Uncharacterized protein n=1 Tax=bioreactor metagenome TaxID=1076179 RepID=A0A645C737_9ZZZZ